MFLLKSFDIKHIILPCKCIF